MPSDSEKHERRTPDEQRLWQEEIAAFSREAELRLCSLKFINSDGKAVAPADWEGRQPPKLPDNILRCITAGRNSWDRRERSRWRATISAVRQ